VLRDYKGRVVLIAGGTKGIGLATGLEFARHGAQCILTHKWGSADEDAIAQQFADLLAPAPLIVEADVREDEDTESLLTGLRERFDAIDVFVSAAAFSQVVKDVDKYSKRNFLRSIEYTTWPIVEYPRQIRKVFGRFPRYVVGLSSGGPDEFYPNYDLVSGCKAALEAISRYMAHRLIDDDVNINILRARIVRTDSLRATTGDAFEGYVDSHDPEMFITVEEVASAVFGLCSGLMDAVHGQTLMIDRGTEFLDGVAGLFDLQQQAAKAGTAS